MLTCKSTEQDHVHTVACYIEQGKQNCSPGTYVRAPWESPDEWPHGYVVWRLQSYDAKADLRDRFAEVIRARNFRKPMYVYGIVECVLFHNSPRNAAAAFGLNLGTLKKICCEIRSELGLSNDL